MAITTFLGNFLVLWGRFGQHDENPAVSLVVRNLAVSDIMMGCYLSLIAIQDHRYREQYQERSIEWVTSWSCVFVGMIGMTSSEVSLFILTFISIERFLLIAGPFGRRRRLNARNVFFALILIWSVGLSIAIMPGIYFYYYK